ncbi:MAG: GAF domain-containing protein [Planctomycetota bacterium]
MRKLCQRLLDRALEALPSRSGAVLLTRPRRPRRFARRTSWRRRRASSSSPTARSSTRCSARTRSRVIDDSRQVPAHLLGPLAQNGFRSLLVAPLHWKKRTLGLLLLMDREPAGATVFKSGRCTWPRPSPRVRGDPAQSPARRIPHGAAQGDRDRAPAADPPMQQPEVKIPGLDIGSVMRGAAARARSAATTSTGTR